MKLSIVKIPAPILREKSKTVAKITPELKQLVFDMQETAESYDGVGLAAPQVGKNICLIITCYQSKNADDEAVPKTVIFNPKITSRSPETEKDSEGCLSVPGVTGVVERFRSITVKGMDEDGMQITLNAADMYARVLQHEIDHVNGILFTDRLKHYRVVFFGTSEFALPSLKSLINHPQFEVVAVITETDKPAGRGHKSTASPIKKLALDHRIPVLQPNHLKENKNDPNSSADANKFLNSFKKLHPDFNIVCSYGKIIPKEILDIPHYFSVNIHPSLLPKYRGATPIQTSLLNGDKETGVSIMLMSPKMDAGPIISMYKYKIAKNDDFGQLSERLSQYSAINLIMTLEEIISDKAEYFEQNHELATYTKKIENSDALIDWKLPHEQILNHIRAMNPKPGAYTEISGLKIKIIKAHLQDESMIIDLVQLAGKKPISLQDLQNGHNQIYTKLIDLISTDI